ncbi:MAG: ATP-binding protein [Candidatus Berkelbacteria bacterium]|nr:ATP-binding protein [Candidatus Berkelbacteria bacterium]
MQETRVNLKRLLEDIRDSYAMSLEEVIVVELIANALDSGASNIDFFVNPLEQTFTIVDNGRGMRRPTLKEYHNIAASTKTRGAGIGFAGIGAKLSLLVADSVITETKGGRGTHAATTWHLSSDTRAPWQFLPCSGIVSTPRGTAVTITLEDIDSALLSRDFIYQTVTSHFYPLFIPEFFEAIYSFIYRNGVKFSLNGNQIDLVDKCLPDTSKIFRIILGRQTKHLAGFGYLAQLKSGEASGLSISTYGKVIKTGWEWAGLEVPSNLGLFGFVEIPALSQILTMNKMDFLRDATSLKKYYQYRKAIQAAIQPILVEFGGNSGIADPVKVLRPLTRQIEHALRAMLGSFPELLPLLGVRATKDNDKAIKALDRQQLIKVAESDHEIETKSSEKKIEPTTKKHNKKRSKTTALAIGYETAGATNPIARMVESRILINTDHPAYLKARSQRVEGYHAVFCVAWSLSHYLEDGRSPQLFINDFLSSWGRQDPQTSRMF